MAKKKQQKDVEMEKAQETLPATKESRELAHATSNEAWGDMGISGQDIIIPRILLQQPMSEKVTAGETKFGEFRESLNWEKLGDFEGGFDILPFYMEKVFIEYNVDDPEDKQYLRTVKITPENEGLPYEDEERDQDTGKMIKISRDKTMNIYVLLPHELDLGTAIPHIISARRTSIQAGKKIATQFAKNAQIGKSPAAVIMHVSSRKQTEDKKTWAVIDVKPVRQTPDKYVGVAFRWMQMIVAGKTKVDTDSYEQEANDEGRTVENSGESVETGPTKF